MKLSVYLVHVNAQTDELWSLVVEMGLYRQLKLYFPLNSLVTFVNFTLFFIQEHTPQKGKRENPSTFLQEEK